MEVEAYLHQFGLHQKGNGVAYHEVWERFLAAKGTKVNPFYLVGFGFGLIGRLPI